MQYNYDQGGERERARPRVLEKTSDPETLRTLENVGVAAGWRCLEISAGSGSVARWLSLRVGNSGTVVATDLDTRFLDHDEEHDPLPQLTVRRHGLLADALEAVVPGLPMITAWGRR